MTIDLSYQQSKSFVLTCGPILFGQQWSPLVPEAIENNERRGAKIAQKGIRMAIADLIERSARLPNDKIIEIDEILRTANIITLTEMRAANVAFVRKFLNKSKLVSEDEVLTIRSIIDLGLIKDDDTVAQLTDLLNKYEKL